MNSSKGSLYRNYIKRFFDFSLALIALIILSPILLVVSILVKIQIGSPILFKQQRPGLNEKIFMMYKFRTMTDQRDGNGELLPDSIRLTKFGKFLRSTSLDELPELLNILKGEMSIVGPRPQLVKDMVFMTELQRKRHTVTPGLTGWAQINGRNCIQWEDKLNFDLDYLNNITFLNDIKIICITLINVFKREGINSEGMATAEDYGDYLLRIGKIDKTQFSQLTKEANKLVNRYYET